MNPFLAESPRTSLLFQTRAYITYWLDAVESHSLHSPFFFDFYNSVVADDCSQAGYAEFERIRSMMLSDPSTLAVTDLGSGSRTNGGSTRRICDIARTSLSPPRRSRLLDRIARYFHSETIVELGTSLGINSLYLAAAKHRRVTTFEGSPGISRVARNNFSEAGVDNIEVLEGDIGKELPRYLEQNRRIDLVFMDANHRYKPTIEYFRTLKPALHAESVVILDDIHYHPEMERAWKELQRDEGIGGSADLFRTGILFPDPSLNKQHVVLQY